MAYLINPEDQDLLDSVREFCDKEIKEQCKEYDVSGEWPAEIYAKIAELGYNGLEVPEEYGGLGLERITVAAIMEEFGKADAGIVSTLTASNLALNHVEIPSDNGILSSKPELTMQNIATVSVKGMDHTDNVILQLMLNRT